MNISDSIFNSDDSQHGYNVGYKDAQAGKSRYNFKAALKAMGTLKFAIHGHSTSKSFTDAYEAGYNKGLEDLYSKKQVQKVEVVMPKHTTHTSSVTTPTINNQYSLNTTTNSMPTLQDYQIQLEQLNELVQFLHQFNEDMSNKLNEYSQRVEMMKENGLPVQTAEKFNMEHIAETANLIQQIHQLIEDKSLPFTHTNIQITEDLIRINS